MSCEVDRADVEPRDLRYVQPGPGADVAGRTGADMHTCSWSLTASAPHKPCSVASVKMLRATEQATRAMQRCNAQRRNVEQAISTDPIASTPAAPGLGDKEGTL